MNNIYLKILISTIALETTSICVWYQNTMGCNKHAKVTQPPSIFPPPQSPNKRTDSASGVQFPSTPNNKTEEQTKLEAIAGEHTSTPASNISIHLKTGKTTGRSYKSWRI